MTRRQALALGAAAGVTAMVGVPGATLGSAAAAVIGGSGGPAYLSRKSYVDRIGQRFVAGDHVLTLLEVDDVEGANTNRRLVGSDDAFWLRFRGVADVLASDIHVVSHEDMGPFPFISPVGPAAGTSQDYGVTIDRTVRVHVGPEAAPTQLVDVTPEGPRKGDEKPAEPSERDLAIIAERLEAARAPIKRRRRRARRAHSHLRRAHNARLRFKRKQALARKRLLRVQSGWLRRHGR